MSKKPTHEENSAHVPRENSVAILLIGTYADTTWRMLVPSVGMTLLGVWLDHLCGTKPWLMIVGIVVGMALAIYLVYRQLQRVRKGSKK